MDGIHVLLLIAIAIGIVLIIAALVSLSKEKPNKPAATDYFEIDNNIKAIDATIDGAEKTMEELNRLSEAVLVEIENKYQELLFLYSLIEEKKNEVYQLYGNRDVEVKHQQKNMENKETIVKIPRNLNPKHDEILELFEQGLSVTDISKKLNMGQGEVKLILELSKTR